MGISPHLWQLAGMVSTFQRLLTDINACALCKERFAVTATQHSPRPVLWVSPDAKPRILIAGQAPGARVHQSGRPFTDPSGDRLRDWLQMDEATFYDASKVAIAPMAFCFPGYNAKGSDLPPPPICAKTWRAPLMEFLREVPLTLLIGGYAMKWHLGKTGNVSETVMDWQSHAPKVFPLPHPSWRNTGWLKKNPWFETDLLPVLRTRVSEVLK
ncbi:uracil-DNA glycosylase family protein [Planktotalea sp.]|uniref:uracil-DNA glycosylase family protein n=1 Tax=Planktotalea sp. TaxID=2029877 RepID=UPI003F6B6E09